MPTSRRTTSRSTTTPASTRTTRATYREEHLRTSTADFLADAAAGTLPTVTFYKPQGNLNQHAGYANLSDGDAHIADVIAKLQAEPAVAGAC